MEVFEPSSTLVIGNGGVRAKFEAWNRKWRSSSRVPTLEIGNGGVLVKFDSWNRKSRSLSQLPTLGIGNGGVRAKFRRLESGMKEFGPQFRRLESL